MGDLGIVARRLVVWAPVYVVAGVLGRLTIIDDRSLSLVWPAAGVAVLWLASASRRTLPYDVVALGSVVFVVNLATGAPPVLAGLFVVTNLSQAAVFVVVVRRLRPALHLFGGQAALSTLRDLSVFVGVALASSALGAVLGTTGLAVLGLEPGLLELLVWWGRNTAGVVVVGILGLLLLHRAAEVAGGVPPRRHPPARRSVVEVSALWVVSAVVLVAVFGDDDALPIGFLLLTTVVLVGVRLGPLAVATHALATASGAMVLTLLGRGPFATLGDLSERALVAQVFVVMTVLTGLVLTFSRSERDDATSALAALERETAERARLMSSVLATMQEGLTVVAADGRVMVSNPAGDRILGKDVGGVVDPDHLQEDFGMRHLDGRRLQAEEAPYVRAAAGATFSEDYLLTRPGHDEPALLEVTAGPLPVDPGEQPQAVITFRDVTALRHDRDALATFAGVVAHDLKRPLTVISGWTDALREDLESGQVDAVAALSMLDRVGGAASRMRHLLDDLLHYTVVRDAPVRLELVDVSLAAEEVAETLRGGDTGARIVVEPGIRAVADPTMLRQALDNLVGNAVKYVAPGVRPLVRVAGQVDDHHTVITVSDNGIGIPPALRSQVFESFRRAHGEEYHGTGLGLAIVRRAVERCGGTVSVRDHRDGTGATSGSVFEVRLQAPG